MIVLNYAHPLSADQLAQVALALGAMPEVRVITAHADRQRPLADVAAELADAAQLTADEWQTLPLVVNPPALAPLALALLAEVHGRSGHFLPILNIRPVADALPPRYELGEITNLQTIREAARTRR